MLPRVLHGIYSSSQKFCKVNMNTVIILIFIDEDNEAHSGLIIYSR